MDRILPIDLERAQLRKSIGGYARKDVDALLAGASETMQQLLVDNDRLRAELETSRSEVERTRLQENTLKDTLVLAQRTADETRAAAHKHAEALIEEARQTAQADRLNRQQEVSDLVWQIEQLKAERERFRDELRAMLDRYRRELDLAPRLTVVEGEISSALAGS